MNAAKMTVSDECGICHETAKPGAWEGQNIGQPCRVDGCDYGKVVRVLKLGRRTIEIACDNPADHARYTSTALVGENLSRERPPKRYISWKNAEAIGKSWLNKHA